MRVALRMAMEVEPDLDRPLSASLDECERRIGYTFSDRSLLHSALTHASGAQHRLASNERLRIMATTAAIRLGRLDGIETFFGDEFATIREGEVVLSDLWFEYQTRRVSQTQGVPIYRKLRDQVRREFPPPRHIDFRMRDDSQ